MRRLDMGEQRPSSSRCLLIKQDPVRGKKLVEAIEVPNIARQDRPTALERLKIQAGVIQQERPFGAFNAQEARHETRQHAGFAHRRFRRRRETMIGHVFDRVSDLAQHAPGAGMGWVDPKRWVNSPRQIVEWLMIRAWSSSSTLNGVRPCKTSI
jgi:hypothetical protein